MMAEQTGPYSIGSDTWPGLSKLIEECGEVQQVAGKLIATGGKTAYWDGSNLGDRLTDELGDLLAAIDFLCQTQGLDTAVIDKRRDVKIALFNRWHSEQSTANPSDSSRRRYPPKSGALKNRNQFF